MQIIQLGRQPYLPILQKMQTFSQTRQADTPDELWLLEHEPVYTLGQAGKSEHILNPKMIPIVQSDRGGQVTYHGPGQLIAYTLLNLKRQHLTIKTLVFQLEEVVIKVLESFDIQGQRRCKAPGIYVGDKKIASIGLRIKTHYSYHGISLNVNMDLEPFKGIHPCGYSALEMTQIADFVPDVSMTLAEQRFASFFCEQFKTKNSSECDHVDCC